MKKIISKIREISWLSDDVMPGANPLKLGGWMFLAGGIAVVASENFVPKPLTPAEERSKIVAEYQTAVGDGRENYIGTFNIHSERTGDNRNCAFYGVDLDSDGTDDFSRMSVPLGRGMLHNEYFDLRNK